VAKKKLLTYAQYNALHGATAKTDLAKGHASLLDLQKQLSKVTHFDETPQTSAERAESIKLKKQIAALQAELPHKPKTGLHKIVAALGPKLIAGAATAGVGAGLAGAASSAFGAGGPLSSVGDTISKVTGGFGPTGPNAASIVGAGGSDVGGFGGTLDDIFGGLSKAGQYAKSAGESLANFRDAFGSNDDGQSAVSYGGGPSSDMGPVAPAATGGMPKWVPLAIGGAVLLLLVVVLMRRR